jgi:hypothetical protein
MSTTQTQTLYLTAQQVAAIRELPVFDGTHAVTIHQAVTEFGAARSEYDGHLIVGESLGAPGIQLDRKGEQVARKAAV